MSKAALAAYEVFMVRRGLAEGTISKRVRVLEILGESGPLLDLDAETIQSVLDARRGRAGGALDARTRHCWLSHAHCFFQWAIAHERTTVDPTARLVRPKMRRKLPRPIPEEPFARAIESAPTELLRAWLLLAGNAGLRCCEIAGLRGEDVQPESLRVVGKNGAERVIPMHERLTALALSWPTSGPVFVDPATGLPYRPAQVSRLIGDHFRRAGLPYRAHHGRHRFASAVYEATGDLNVVADLCGHESIETTRIYAKVTVARRRAAVAMIA